MNGVTAHAADDDEIIEFQGDRYVIHVDRMNPDSEMTLMDVLNTCPEFMSINGKKIDQNYKLRTDNIDLVVDAESFLAHVKACEISHIQICSNTSVAKAVNGTKGVIDMVGAHCVNHNAHSIGICYEGGLDIRGQPADTRTPAQKAAMRTLLEELHGRYPRAVIVGHHDLNPQKPCPSIENVIHEYADLQPKKSK